MTLLKKAGVMALIAWSMAATVLRAWRMPNDFAEAHWLLNYEFGFIKRALPGEILSTVTNLFSHPVTAELIACIATIFFLLFCSALLYIAWRILQRSDWSSNAILIVIVFVCSPFMVMSAHVNGYYDNIVILLGACALYLIQNNKIWFAAILLGISMLVHENTLLLTFPVFCFSWLLINRQRWQEKQTPLSFMPLLLPPLMFLAVVLGTLHLQDGNFIALFSAKLATFSFIQEDRSNLVPQWIVGGTDQSTAPHIGETLLYLGSLASQHLITPSLLVILFFTTVSFGKQQHNSELLVLMGVCLAPQLMHLVAWDTPRIWTYSILASFLALWVYSENRQGIRQEPAVNSVYLIALLLNIMILTPLMDSEYDQLYDIDKRLAYFGPVILGSLILALHRKPLVLNQ